MDVRTNEREDAPVLAAADRAPRPLSRRRKAWMVFKVVELRLRFIAILAATAFGFAYWDTLWNMYETWRLPPSAAPAAGATSDIEYFCPMHPSVIQAQPGKCPICAMPLSKRKKGEKAALPPGVTARVELSPLRVAQGRVQTVEASYAPVSQTIKTVGSIEVDERRLARISQKIKGQARIEKLYVNFKGTAVKAGERLAELYSTDLDQAVQELLLANRSNNAVLKNAAMRRLRLWGIQQAQIDGILRDGKAIDRLPVFAPIAGIVLEKYVVEGQYLNEGDPLFEVADLSVVWIKAQVYEDQQARIQVGQKVEAAVASFPGETFSGTVAFIDPTLNPSTRTVDVRLDLENPNLRLRPGMYASVSIEAKILGAKPPPTPASSPRIRTAQLTAQQQKFCPVTKQELGSMGEPLAVEVEGRKVWICCEGCETSLKADPKKYLARLVAAAAPPPSGQALVLPESAVIDTGTRKIVYVETEPNVYEGREVQLGPPADGVYPVLSGIAPGDKVAASGAFLIDAETRLNPGVAATYMGSGSASGPAPPSESAAAPAPQTHSH